MIKKVVVLSNSAILNLLGQKNFTKEFPAARKIAKAVKGRPKNCGCSGRPKNADRAIADFKLMLRNMPPDNKIKFKKTLGAKNVRMYIDGKTITI